MTTTSNRRRAVRASIVTAVLVLALTSCNKALMVGDSVTVGAAGATQQRLNDLGWQASVNGQIGRTTGEVLNVIRANRGDNNIFIVEAGYNDAADTVAFANNMRTIMDELANADRVIVLTLSELSGRPYYVTANQNIWALASTHPNVTVADWASTVRCYCGLTQSDGIHLTPAGANAMANLVGNTVGQFNG